MGWLHALRQRVRRTGDWDAQTLRAVYRAVGAREPDDQEVAATLERLHTAALSPAGLLAEIAASRPSPSADPRLSELGDPLAEFTDAQRERADSLEAMRHLSAPAFDTAWQASFPDDEELIVGQREYLQVHRRRFRELFNAVIALTDDAPRILEIGTSEASRLYRHFRPAAEMVTADRPVAQDYVGFTPEKSQRIADAQRHVAIDLEHADPATHRDLAAAGPFDMIVFTEVLEHLVARPVGLVAGLLSQLREQGILYITTPNFLSRANRRALTDGRNPQPFYPGSDANWDRHHHFREYTMRELIEVVHAAGGEVYAAYYSACWDHGPDAADGPPPADQRANLVVLARRKRADHAP